MLLKLRKLTAVVAIGALSFSSWQAAAIQGRGNSKNLCRTQPNDAEIQAQNLSEISCKAEITALKCDEFFETPEERKEFERQCPPSKEERQINGGDLGAVCLRQMFNPTIDSIKGVAAFIAAGMKESAENRQKFVAECEAAPDFKSKILKTIPDYSGFTRAQIEKFPCSQLVGDFQDNEARQKEYQVNQRAEAAYKKYASVPHTDDESEIGRNPFLAVIQHNKDKWKCLNQAGHYEMFCYVVFSIVDPTMIAGGAGAAVKSARLAKLFEKGNIVADLPRSSISASPGEIFKRIRENLIQRTSKDLSQTSIPVSANGVDQLNVNLGKRLGSGFRGSVYEVTNPGKFCDPCTPVIKFAHETSLSLPGAAARDAAAAKDIRDEFLTYNYLKENIKNIDANLSEQFAWPKNRLPTADIYKMLETASGPALIKERIPGDSLSKILEKKGSEGLTPEMLSSLKEISKYELLVKDLKNPVRNGKGREKFIIDINPSNLVWVDDSITMAKFGLKRPSFLFYEITPLQVRNNSQFKQILAVASSEAQPNDSQRFLWGSYIQSKIQEIPYLNRTYVDEMSMRANLLLNTKTKEKVLVKVSDLFSIHPITDERPSSVATLEKRTEAFRQRAASLNNSTVVTESELNEIAPSKNSMRAIKVKDGCYIVFDGNGRLAAFRNAIQKADEKKIEIELWEPNNSINIIDSMKSIMGTYGLKACK